MSSKAFEKQIDNWIKRTEADIAETHRESVRTITNELVAAAPNVTGNLRRSISVAKTPQYEGTPDQQFTDPTAANNAVISSLEPGDHAYLQVTAAYGLKEEYGRTGSDGTHQPGKFFVTSVASRWRGIVNRIASNKKRKR